MFQFIRICGISGILILFATIILLIVGIVTVNSSRSKKTVVIFALVSLIPLTLGLLATASTFAKVKYHSEINNYPLPEPDSPRYEVYQNSCAEAKYPIYLGVGSSALLLSIAGIGASIKKEKQEQEN